MAGEYAIAHVNYRHSEADAPDSKPVERRLRWSPSM